MSFGSQSNVRLLWEIVQDEPAFGYLTPDQQRAVHEVFLANLEGFYRNEGRGGGQQSLMDLNKKFILLIMGYIRKTYGGGGRIRIQPQPAAATGSANKPKIDVEFLRAKQAFEDEVNVKPPAAPSFQDDLQELPSISPSQMEAFVRTRDQELEGLLPPPAVAAAANDWLNPAATSVKQDKHQKPLQRVSFQDEEESTPPPLKLKRKIHAPPEHDDPSIPAYDQYEPHNNNNNNNSSSVSHQQEAPVRPMREENVFVEPAVVGNTHELLLELRRDVQQVQEQLRLIHTMLSKLSLA